MSKLQISVTRKALNLDNKVEGINLSDGGKGGCVVAEDIRFGHTKIMNILKREREIHDNFENNVLSSKT